MAGLPAGIPAMWKALSICAAVAIDPGGCGVLAGWAATLSPTLSRAVDDDGIFELLLLHLADRLAGNLAMHKAVGSLV